MIYTTLSFTIIVNYRPYFYVEWAPGIRTYLPFEPWNGFASWSPCQASKTIWGCQVSRYSAEASPAETRNRCALLLALWFFICKKVLWHFEWAWTCRLVLICTCAGGVDTASTDGIFDISNLDRLGYSEVELVQKVVDGVKLLIEVHRHCCS